SMIKALLDHYGDVVPFRNLTNLKDKICDGDLSDKNDLFINLDESAEFEKKKKILERVLIPTKFVFIRKIPHRVPNFVNRNK
ncbi:hypothetical protein HK096_011064, partial [Nowakowskiella sp. JEL0078]